MLIDGFQLQMQHYALGGRDGNVVQFKKNTFRMFCSARVCFGWKLTWFRCAQTRENASIHRTRAGDGSSGLVWTSRVGRPAAPLPATVEVSVAAAAVVGGGAGGCCSTMAAVALPATSPEEMSASTVTAGTDAGGGLHIENDAYLLLIIPMTMTLFPS